MQNYDCGHELKGDTFGLDFFGQTPGLCPDCKEAMKFYNACFRAMAGNVYDKAMLADAGLISAISPTLGDLNRASVTLYARLTESVKKLLYQETLADLDAIEK